MKELWKHMLQIAFKVSSATIQILFCEWELQLLTHTDEDFFHLFCGIPFEKLREVINVEFKADLLTFIKFFFKYDTY